MLGTSFSSGKTTYPSFPVLWYKIECITFIRYYCNSGSSSPCTTSWLCHSSSKPCTGSRRSRQLQPLKSTLPGTSRVRFSARGACASLVSFACNDGGTRSPGGVGDTSAAAAYDVRLQMYRYALVVVARSLAVVLLEVQAAYLASCCLLSSRLGAP